MLKEWCLSKLHKVLRETRFENERLNPIGVELMTLSELRARVSARMLSEMERVEFFLALVATEGRGEHLVDLERIALRAGDVVFVRPGQIQQWRPRVGFEADLLLIDPAVVQPAATVSPPAAMALLGMEDWPSHFRMHSEELSAWKSLAAVLRQELDQPQLDDLAAAMARELLLCLVLKMSRSATRHAETQPVQAMLMRRFRRELEGSIGARPTVAQLARRLRVSASTLTRACNDVLGRSAKEEIDRRVALEAQRLLVHSMSTSVVIGEQLGFSEPTNFVKFFRRRVGTTPDAFRKAHQALK